MERVAVMMSSESVSAKMSEHFGKAECILVAGLQGEEPTFLPNDTTNGHGAARIVHRQGCSDAIVTGIGAGAVAQLKSLGIRVWAAPRGISGAQALELFRHGTLPEVVVSAGHENGGGCCGGGSHEGRSSCCSHS